jgi:hypothetical protein
VEHGGHEAGVGVADENAGAGVGVVFFDDARGAHGEDLYAFWVGAVGAGGVGQAVAHGVVEAVNFVAGDPCGCPEHVTEVQVAVIEYPA